MTLQSLLQGWRGGLFAVALALAAGLAGLFTLPVMDRDEGRYVQASAQMLESGDFVRIQFMDEPRNKKPAGIHWLQAASVAAFPNAEARRIWAYRLPSLLGAALAVFACWRVGRRLLGDPAAAAGAAILAVCVLLGVEAGLAKTDAVLCAATTLAVAALARLRFGAGGRWTAIGFWVAMAAAVLVKGPIGPLLAGLTVAALFAWERRVGWVRPLAWWPGPVLFVALALPWFVAVQLAGSGFLQEAVGVDLAPKLVSASEGHAGPPGYHTLALMLQLWPGTLFLIPGAVLAVQAARRARTDEEAPPWRFLLAWAIPFLIVLELTPTKLSHYGLPAYPALALIAGGGFAALTGGRAMPISRLVSSVIYGLGAVAFVAVLVALAWLYAPAARIPAIIFAAPCAGLALAALFLGRRPAGLMLALAAALVWHVGARGFVAPQTLPLSLSARVAALMPDAARPAGVMGYREPSFVFQMGGRLEFLDDEAAVLAAIAEGRFASYAVPRQAAPIVLGALRVRSGCGEILGEIEGLNYSNGQRVDLVVLGAACQEPPRRRDAPSPEPPGGGD